MNTKKYLHLTITNPAGTTFTNPLKLSEAHLISTIAQENSVAKKHINLFSDNKHIKLKTQTMKKSTASTRSVNFLPLIVLAIAIILILASCSTQKSYYNERGKGCPRDTGAWEAKNRFRA